jgi:hypothetical protein
MARTRHRIHFGGKTEENGLCAKLGEHFISGWESTGGFRPVLLTGFLTFRSSSMMAEIDYSLTTKSV